MNSSITVCPYGDVYLDDSMKDEEESEKEKDMAYKEEKMIACPQGTRNK